MILIAITLLVAFLSGGIWIGLFFLFLSFHTLLGILPGDPHPVVIFSYTVALPLTAYCAGLLVDQLCFERIGGKGIGREPLAMLSAVCAGVLMLRSVRVFDYLSVAISSTNDLDWSKTVAVLSDAIGTGIGCAVVIGGAFLFLNMILEGGARWALSATENQAEVRVEALRPLAALLFFSLALEAVSGLLGRSFWPAG